MTDPFIAQVMLLNTIGLTVLTQALKSAENFFYMKSSNPRSQAAQSYVFIQGTGLEILIDHYGLGYDAEGIRQTFNYYMKRNKDGQ